MKITYIGDLHIGSSLSHIFSVRARQTYRALYNSWIKEFKTAVLEENPDIVVILGDLVDNSALTLSFRSLDALSTFYGMLGELTSKGKQVVYVTGNHDIRILDSSDNLSAEYKNVGSILTSFSDRILFVEPHKVSVIPFIEDEKIIVNIGYIEDEAIIPTLRKTFEIVSNQGYLASPKDIIIHGHFTILFNDSPFYVRDGITSSLVLKELSEFLVPNKVKSLTLVLGHIHIFSTNEAEINGVPVRLVYPGSPFPLSFGEAVNNLGSGLYSTFPRYLFSINSGTVSFKELTAKVPILLRYRVQEVENQTSESLKSLLLSKEKEFSSLSSEKVLFLDHIIPEKTREKTFQEYREKFTNFGIEGYTIYQRFRVKSKQWSPGELEKMSMSRINSIESEDSQELNIRDFIRASIIKHLDESLKELVPEEKIPTIKSRVTKILDKR